MLTKHDIFWKGAKGKSIYLVPSKYPRSHAKCKHISTHTGPNRSKKVAKLVHEHEDADHHDESNEILQKVHDHLRMKALSKRTCHLAGFAVDEHNVVQ